MRNYLKFGGEELFKVHVDEVGEGAVGLAVEGDGVRGFVEAEGVAVVEAEDEALGRLFLIVGVEGILRVQGGVEGASGVVVAVDSQDGVWDAEGFLALAHAPHFIVVEGTQELVGLQGLAVDGDIEVEEHFVGVLPLNHAPRSLYGDVAGVVDAHLHGDGGDYGFALAHGHDLIVLDGDDVGVAGHPVEGGVADGVGVESWRQRGTVAHHEQEFVAIQGHGGWRHGGLEREQLSAGVEEYCQQERQQRQRSM